MWIPFKQEYFVSCLLESSQAVLEKIFKSCQYIFNLLQYVLSPLWNGARSFIWKHLNPKMVCAKFGWNWPGGSEEEVVSVFLLCSYYLPLTKGMALRLNKLNCLHLWMLYVKYDGTWLNDSEEVKKIWMDIGQKDNKQRVFFQAYLSF